MDFCAGVHSGHFVCHRDHRQHARLSGEYVIGSLYSHSSHGRPLCNFGKLSIGSIIFLPLTKAFT
jgi:hypothetical protein